MEGCSASFSLKDYCFDEINFLMNMIDRNKSFNVNFDPSCVFKKENSQAELTIKVSVSSDGKDSPFCVVSCKSNFVFDGVAGKNDIPNYFYTNSVAILYPYIRAMVSLVTMQANIGRPVVLPVLNLTPLGEELKQLTKEV
ncbi:hypothetical protein [Fibrobacter sp.]|uniref:hypothetical protein n=1 Tax=Fibrobacter sp. TaxID=35828 RepID=UPI00388DC3E7